MQQKEQYYTVNDIKLHLVEQGNEIAPVILFLSGFPEFSYAWKAQLPFFADKGFRAIAVDQRGYFLSSKPASVSSYHLRHLTEDIKELVKSLTTEKIVLVGHDWGGGVAWAFAQTHPELLHKLVILNMPHPAVIARTLKRRFSQQIRSWYAAFFQIPFLPEILLQQFNYWFVRNSMERTSVRGTFSEEDFDKYRQAWRQPEALRSMINWYRANKFSLGKFKEVISVPVLLIWGSKDAFLIKELAQLSIQQCLNGKLVMIDDATHWIHHEQPEKVNNVIFQFVQKTDS